MSTDVVYHKRKNMAVLPHQTINAEIVKNGLITNLVPANVKASSYDLRIGTIFLNGTIIKDDAQQVILKPGQIVSLFTEEEVRLPNDIAGTVFPMNAQSSRGLLVLNPGHVDPGFEGPLTVKLLNMRRTEMVIQRKMEILTIVFERLEEATSKPYTDNKLRDARELAFNASDVEISPNTLGDLVTLTKEAPFPSRSEVKELINTGPFPNRIEVKDMIRESMNARQLYFFAAIGAVAAIAGAIFAGMALFKSDAGSQVQPEPKQSSSSDAGTPAKAPSSVVMKGGGSKGEN
jgi:deoxycytidine triphosphate deaminase